MTEANWQVIGIVPVGDFEKHTWSQIDGNGVYHNDRAWLYVQRLSHDGTAREPARLELQLTAPRGLPGAYYEIMATGEDEHGVRHTDRLWFWRRLVTPTGGEPNVGPWELMYDIRAPVGPPGGHYLIESEIQPDAPHVSYFYRRYVPAGGGPPGPREHFGGVVAPPGPPGPGITIYHASSSLVGLPSPHEFVSWSNVAYQAVAFYAATLLEMFDRPTTFHYWYNMLWRAANVVIPIDTDQLLGLVGQLSPAGIDALRQESVIDEAAKLLYCELVNRPGQTNTDIDAQSAALGLPSDYDGGPGTAHQYLAAVTAWRATQEKEPWRAAVAHWRATSIGPHSKDYSDLPCTPAVQYWQQTHDFTQSDHQWTPTAGDWSRDATGWRAGGLPPEQHLTIVRDWANLIELTRIEIVWENMTTGVRRVDNGPATIYTNYSDFGPLVIDVIAVNSLWSNRLRLRVQSSNQNVWRLKSVHLQGRGVEPGL